MTHDLPLPPAAAGAAERMPHLDALRGIAAFAVVLHHALLALPEADGLRAAIARFGVLRIVELGRPAVILFFVLSGFVLTLCLEPRRDTLAGFAARRALRLLPPYWVAIIGAAIFYAFVPHHRAAGLSQWFNDQWATPLPVRDLARHLLMLAGPRQFPLDHVAWSLVHELRLSLAVPLLVLLAARGGVALCLAGAVAVTLGAEAIIAASPASFPVGFHGFRFDAEGLVPSLVLSARTLAPFALGVAVAMRRRPIALLLSRHPWITPVGLAVAVALLSCDSEPVMMIGSAGLIVIVACAAPCARALAVAPLAWLGRTSYSLYLVHVPTMLVCGLLLEGLLPPRATLGLAIVLSLVLADLMFRRVERPSIRWSRAAAKVLSARRAEPITAAVLATPAIAEG